MGFSNILVAILDFANLKVKVYKYRTFIWQISIQHTQIM